MDAIRHNFNNSQFVKIHSFESLATIWNPVNPLGALISPCPRIAKNYVVISCFSELYEWPNVFGDWVEFGHNIDYKIQRGIYHRQGQYRKVWDIIDLLLDHKNEQGLNDVHVFMIMPQRYPEFTELTNKKNFTYIELPEFYGVYYDFFSEYYPDNVKPEIQKHFLMLNKRSNFHRQSCFTHALNNNILDKGHVSFLGYTGGEERSQESNEQLSNMHNLITRIWPDIKVSVDDIIKLLPYQSNPTAMEIVDNFCYQGGWIQDRSLFDTSFVNVVCETYNNQHWSMVYTEKIFKPIWFKRPFLLVGSRGALAGLKQLGFKTFDRWFNEGYDIQIEPHTRVECVMKELDRICSMSLEECNQILAEMQPILEHNHNRLIELKSELGNRLNEIDMLINQTIDTTYFRDTKTHYVWSTYG